MAITRQRIIPIRRRGAFHVLYQGAVNENRVNRQRAGAYRKRRPQGCAIPAVKRIAPTDWFALAGVKLMELPGFFSRKTRCARGFDFQIAPGFIDRCALKLQRNCRYATARGHFKVEFQLLLVDVDQQIDPRIHFRKPHSPEAMDIGSPLARVLFSVIIVTSGKESELSAMPLAGSPQLDAHHFRCGVSFVPRKA